MSARYLLPPLNAQPPHRVFLQDTKRSGLLNSLVRCCFFPSRGAFYMPFPRNVVPLLIVRKHIKHMVFLLTTTAAPAEQMVGSWKSHLSRGGVGE